MCKLGLSRPVRWVVLVGICLFVVSNSRGQVAGGASVSGEVIDQQGGTIQDATVILLNSAAVRLQETKTDQSGAFTFRNLSPGDYVVDVERSGFSGVHKSVTLAAGQVGTRVSIELKVAGPGQQVTVSAELGSFGPTNPRRRRRPTFRSTRFLRGLESPIRPSFRASRTSASPTPAKISAA